MIAYKVIREENKKLYSCIIQSKEHRVQYYKTKWTEGKHLCCFRSPEEACNFRVEPVETLRIFIFKCEVILSRGRKPRRRVLYQGGISPITSSTSWPKGTIFCSKVRLLERVY